MRGSLEVAHIVRSYGPRYRNIHGHTMPLRQLRALRAIEVCRTAELGGHVEQCDHCSAVRISYNSCRNRHCPKGQCMDKERWLEARKRDVLPVRYFHLVFTLPDILRPLALRNQRVIYDLLFKAASETLREVAAASQYLGAEIGFIAMLHTWSQTLMDHPHLHCMVTGGGLSLDGHKWIPCKRRFFIPVKVLSRLFRGIFLAYLKEAREKGNLIFPGTIASLKEEQSFNAMLHDLYQKEWVVYCKPPFTSAETLIEYLGRYTHRVAISNDRLVNLEGDRVTFRYRDRKDNDTSKLMSLEVSEFIRRFLLHVLPDGFMKIRHYGILSNRNRKTKLARCKELLGVPLLTQHPEAPREPWQVLLARITGRDPRICPFCGKGIMVLKEVLIPSPFPMPP